MIELLNRRRFLKTAASLSVLTIAYSAGTLFAQNSQTLKVALIGCGRRGKKTLENIQEAAAYLQIKIQVTALADYVKEHVMAAAEVFNVPASNCFDGAKAYQAAMKTDADIVLLVTPPVFRPLHFEAAVNAGKHVFMEKPVAVDPWGVHKIIESGKWAQQKKLSIVAGTQKRHSLDYLKTYDAVKQGAIGLIRSGIVQWCQGSLPRYERNLNEKEDFYLIRNWKNFTEMSGDHLVEQHIHNIDIANWFIGRPPKAALGVGGRVRRETGNQYDFFSVDFDYGEDVHVHSLCRQIDGCYNRKIEFFTGTIGTTWGPGPGSEGFAKETRIPEIQGVSDPYVQEHIDLLKSICDGTTLNETQSAAESTMTAIMGRISAYSGHLVRWKDLMDERTGSPWYNLKMKPSAEDFENGTVRIPTENQASLPGKY